VVRIHSPRPIHAIPINSMTSKPSKKVSMSLPRRLSNLASWSSTSSALPETPLSIDRVINPVKVQRLSLPFPCHLRDTPRETYSATTGPNVARSPEGRPIGNFLFLGPTGTGKTRAVEATAEALLGNPRAVIKIDCGEFQHSHEIAKLIGSPPGYLGHRETHALLSQEALSQYRTENKKLTFVLFDEIEKASDALWNLLLGILDKATLTLGDNRKVDFSNALIFMTSNIGAAEMSSLVSPKLGFNVSTPGDGNCAPTLAAEVSRAGIQAARRKFTPEFLNRLDKIVVFRALGNEEPNRIIDMELERAQQRVQSASAGKPFLINVTGTARKFLLTEGIDLRYGARPLKRAIERLLVHPLSNMRASGQIQHHDRIHVTHNGESPSLTFFREADAWESWKTNGVAAA